MTLRSVSGVVVLNLDRKRKALRAFDTALGACLVFDPMRRAPVGRALEKLPKEVQEDLKGLRSSDLLQRRSDSVL